MKLLSGMTLGHWEAQRLVNTFGERLQGTRSLSSAESLASPGQSPAPGLGRMIREIYGQPRLASLNKWTHGVCRPPESLLKTCPEGSREDSLSESRSTWSDWATKLLQLSSRLDQSGQHTAAAGYSSLASGQVNQSPTSQNSLDQSGPWPTPRASDRNGPAKEGQQRADLATKTRDWQTPRHNEQRGSAYQVIGLNRDKRVATLTGESTEWQTPTVGNSVGTNLSRSGTRKEEMLLPGQAIRDWRSPSASDGEGGVMDIDLAEKEGFNPKIKLRDDAPHWRTPSFSPQPKLDMSRSGELFLRKMSHLRLWCWFRARIKAGASKAFCERLNPRFVEWLMGWPPGWTDAQTALPEQEMEWYHSKLRWPFLYWLEACLEIPNE